jgi:putative radical SAM enzyme (TIGR03279 family)
MTGHGGGPANGGEFANGGVISSLDPDGIGAEIGLEPGDVLVSINGHVLRDVIDYRFYGDEEELVLIVERAGEQHRLEIERDLDEDLGIAFAEPTFDGMRQCINHCPFCFVQQMPRGLRRTLYIHDDDYRYSFLQGNFITLTNLSEEDWERLTTQRLSPLYVSVHATDLETRRRLLGNPQAPDILAQLRRLREARIQVHGQTVLVPGMNDAAVLERSIADLAALWPTVQTLALVPVGLTRHQRGVVRRLTPEEARAVLDIAERVGPGLRKRTRRTWLYPSDELYLLAGRTVPPARFYDDDAQRENGVGLVRELLDDWAEVAEQVRPVAGPIRRATLACGALIAPVLAQLAGELSARSGVALEVVAVPNGLFGESVTVSGLLTGQDVLAALKGRDLGDRVYLPLVMFGEEGERTLDEISPSDLAAALGKPVALVETLSEVYHSLGRS